MKRFEIICTILVFQLLALASCSDGASEIIESCGQADWIGTYMGTEQCDDETPDFMMLNRTIEAGETSDEIIYDGNTYKFVDCTAEIEGIDSLQNFRWVSKLELLPGDSISIVRTVDVAGGLSCRYFGQK